MIIEPVAGSKTRGKICEESKKLTDEINEAVSKGKKKLSSLKEEIEHYC
jgi:hypothetical protein